MLCRKAQWGYGLFWSSLYESGEFRLEKFDGITDEPRTVDWTYRIIQVKPWYSRNSIRAIAATLYEIRGDWQKLLGFDCPYKEAA